MSQSKATNLAFMFSLCLFVFSQKPQAQTIELFSGKTLPGSAHKKPFEVGQNGMTHLGLSAAWALSNKVFMVVRTVGYHRHIICNRGICDYESISKAFYPTLGMRYSVISKEYWEVKIGSNFGFLKERQTLKGITFPWLFSGNRTYWAYDLSGRIERKNVFSNRTGVFLQASALRLISRYNPDLQYGSSSISPFDIGNFKDFPHDLVYNFSLGMSYNFGKKTENP